MVNINKSFSGVRVLKDVNFGVRESEVHALLGENGAGKSVLMKTLMGVYQPDSGEYKVGEKKVRFANPAEAQRNRVSMVYQEFGLINYLSATENILMGRLPTKWGTIRWSKAKQRAAELLEQLGSSISPDTIVGDLKVAEQQEVEIARALSYDPLVFIMDEPSSALSRVEIDHLYELVKILRTRGTSIVYITHKLEEVFELADRATVIRDGSIIGTYNISELDTPMLIEKMTNKRISAEIVRKDEYKKPETNVLELQHLTAGGMFDDVSLTVGSGEIVGIAGVIGAGKSELARAIFGALPRTTCVTGRILLHGQEVDVRSLTPNKTRNLGIGFVSEDRMAEGLVAEQSILFNTILSALSRVTLGHVIINGKIARHLVRRIIGDSALRPPDPNKLVKFLSGGNQQKVVIGKWLFAESKLLILDEVTRGVDVGAREGIYSVIRQQARDKGLGILLLSSDLREILIASDRILVMRQGRISNEVYPHQTTERELLNLVVGGGEGN
jgi:ABC-type sugar transport system ATPase subunit